MLFTRSTGLILFNHFLSVFLPILTLKYVVGVLDNQQFGVIVYYSMIFSYLGMLIEFGFGLSSIRELVLVQGDVKRASEIYSSVVILKICLFVIATFLLLVIFEYFSELAFEKYILFIGVLVLMNRILDNFWVFQVYNNIGVYVVVSFFSKIFYPISILMLLNSKEEFWLVLLMPAILNFFSNIIYTYIIRTKIGLSFLVPNFQVIINQFKLAMSFFWSIFFSNIYTSLSFIFLGFFTSPQEISLIGSADRLIQPLKAGFSAISQALYPDFNTLFIKNSKYGFIKVFWYARVIGLLILIVSTLLFINAEKIYLLVYGQKFKDGIIFFRVLIFLPGIVFLGNMFGVQGLLSVKKDMYYLKVIIIAAFLSSILNFWFVPKYLSMAYVLILVSIESLILVSFFIKMLQLRKRYV